MTDNYCEEKQQQHQQLSPEEGGGLGLWGEEAKRAQQAEEAGEACGGDERPDGPVHNNGPSPLPSLSGGPSGREEEHQPASSTTSPQQPQEREGLDSAVAGMILMPEPGPAATTIISSSPPPTTDSTDGGGIGMPLDDSEEDDETEREILLPLNHGQQQQQQHQPHHESVLLEDRVCELETKLAVLSRLLQQSQSQSQSQSQQQQQSQSQHQQSQSLQQHYDDYDDDDIDMGGSLNRIIVYRPATPPPPPPSSRMRDPPLESPAPGLEASGYYDRKQQQQQDVHRQQRNNTNTNPHRHHHQSSGTAALTTLFSNDELDQPQQQQQPALIIGEEEEVEEPEGEAADAGIAPLRTNSNSNSNSNISNGSSSLSPRRYRSRSRSPPSTYPRNNLLPPLPPPDRLQSHSRNLSFRLLFDGDEDAYQRGHDVLASVPPTTSMTPAERQWLQPKVMQYVQEREQRERERRERDEGETKVRDNNAPSTSSSTVPTTTTDAAAAHKNPSEPKKPNNQEECNESSAATLEASNRGEREDYDDEDDEKRIRSNWLNYLNSFKESAPDDVDVRMQEFIQVPGKVEKLLCFGLVICLDSYLYVITILPIRFVWSLLLLVLNVLVPRRILFSAESSPQGQQQQHQGSPLPSPQSPWRFHRRHSYQIIQVFILYSIYRYVLLNISIGKVYHWIRGQSMIKLYVLSAMVEVFDRLFSSLGQDCLDSLYWNTLNRPRSVRMVVSVVVVWVYATLHSLILFIHVETLNVAMNSDDQALLTLLISGNFAEIKSTVFKKYNKPALFKITASDICERFKLGLFLSLVLLLNVCQGMEPGQLADYWRVCGIVWSAELVSDWIKHSFITKFNFLPSKVYPEYALLLAGDVTGIGHEGVNIDHSHAVVKRIGFAQTPLVCLMFRLVREAAKYAQRNPYFHSLGVGAYMTKRWFGAAVALGCWLVLLAVKMVLGSLLQRASLARLRAAPDVVPIKKLSISSKRKKA